MGTHISAGMEQVAAAVGAGWRPTGARGDRALSEAARRLEKKLKNIKKRLEELRR